VNVEVVPVWANPNPNDYVYLYSAFGGSESLPRRGGIPAGNHGASEGFEEWAIGQAGSIAAIPEPASILPA
jgi:hypothetical protein